MGELPKLKKTGQKQKITLYFEPDVERLYKIGKQNGWDVSELVRQAASEALRAAAEQLVIPATEVDKK